MKYNLDHVYSTYNTIKISVDQNGSKAMIREKDQEKATLRQGYRVMADGDTLVCGQWNETEKEVLFTAIKYEHYKAEAYKELYNDLIQKLNSIGLRFVSEDSEDEY